MGGAYEIGVSFVFLAFAECKRYCDIAAGLHACSPEWAGDVYGGEGYGGNGIALYGIVCVFDGRSCHGSDCYACGKACDKDSFHCIRI